jgi:tetratricopeptide (TPR) repeat protein
MDNFDEILDSLENEKQWVIFVRQSHRKATESQYQLYIELAKKALELNPRSAEAYCLIANAYEKLAEE